MKLKILSLVLIIMLVSFPVTHVMAMPIQEDCQKAVTEDDLKTYIKHHVIAGEKEHCAFVLLKERKFDTSEECHNPSHEHMRLFSTIRVKDVCKIQYKCLDQNGDKWRIDIEGKIGDSAGLCWYSHTYDLNEINSTDLLQLFNLMISVDQYLDATGMDVLIKLAKNVVEGGTDIAGTLVAVAKWGGQNPLYG